MIIIEGDCLESFYLLIQEYSAIFRMEVKCYVFSKTLIY